MVMQPNNECGKEKNAPSRLDGECYRPLGLGFPGLLRFLLNAHREGQSRTETGG
jgi:hypothetical protein